MGQTSPLSIGIGDGLRGAMSIYVDTDNDNDNDQEFEIPVAQSALIRAHSTLSH